MTAWPRRDSERYRALRTRYSPGYIGGAARRKYASTVQIPHREETAGGRHQLTVALPVNVSAPGRSSYSPEGKQRAR